MWDGFRDERSEAVERPIPEEEPVMSIVFGVEERDFRFDGERGRSDILCNGVGLIYGM